MNYPFYNGYTIDDSNMGCDTIIVSKCDGTHVYYDPCTLIQDCIPKQLTNECVVDFLNTGILSAVPGQYLQVDTNGCLTTSVPECPCGDELVGATNGDDIPGYLIDKIIGGKNGDYEITIGTPNPRVIQVMPHGPNTPFTDASVPDRPECDDAFVKINGEGVVYYDCGYGNNSLWANRYLNEDIVINTEQESYISYIFVPNMPFNLPWLRNVGNMARFRGNPDMAGVSAFTDGSIKIVQTAMYDIDFRVEAVVDSSVVRIRGFVCAYDPEFSQDVGLRVLSDFKDGPEEPNIPIPYGYYKPDGTFFQSDSTTRTVVGHSKLMLKAGRNIMLGVKIDTRGTGKTGQVRIRRNVFDLKSIVGGFTETYEQTGVGAGSNFQVAFYSPYTFNFQYD